MKQTEQTLLEQMRITEIEIDNRKTLFKISQADELALKSLAAHITDTIDELVDKFYETQTSTPEIALLIGDLDTLKRLKNAQKRYIIDLFSGFYDMEYVNNRLRIGLVHKRIGVEPKLYLAAIETLKELLTQLIDKTVKEPHARDGVIAALHKLLMFDISLVFDTYIRSMIAEIEISRQKSDSYANALEAKIKERTLQLETLSKTDALTGLFNVRYLDTLLTKTLRAAQRRNEPVTLIYIDIDDFKIINDTQGHQQGDKVLQTVSDALKAISRIEDHCFRYGGDEFCVIMTQCTLASALIWQDRLLMHLAEQDPTIAISIGIAQAGPDKYVGATELIHLADQAMYNTKSTHKAQPEPNKP